MVSFLKVQVPEESVRLVNECLAKGQLAQGPLIQQLETSFAEYCGVQHAVAVSNGTAALHLSLLALGIGPGDEVITTPFTFAATVNAIILCGAKPVFVDIESGTFCLDVRKVEAFVNEKTKAIIPVDIFGRLCDYEALCDLAEQHQLKILEDSCQAIGAVMNEKKAGSFGDMGVFSFYATKNIFSGEGGMIVTDSSELAERCRILRNHGMSGKVRNDYVEAGFNYRMTDIEAAVVLPQLDTLDQHIVRRMEIVQFYQEALQDLPGVVCPSLEGSRSVFHLYTLRIPESKGRDEVQKALREKGVETAVYYPKPLHLYPPYQGYGSSEGDLPEAEAACKEVLSLPLYPSLKDEECEQVVEALKAVLSS